MAVFVIIVLLASFVTSMRAHSCHHACRRSNETRIMNHEGDSFYSLTLEQPQGLNYANPKKYISDKTQGAPTWTIHGLWLSYNGQPKTCCNRLGPLDLSNISEDVQSEMKASWMSLTNKKDDKEFWSHEWCKHGDCVAGTFTSHDNPTNEYFSRTVRLYQKYDIKDILDKNGITPGNEYKGTEIIDAIRDDINVTPQILCGRSKDDGQQVLIELMLCFHDTSFTPADCPEGIGYGQNEECGDKVLYKPKPQQD